MKGIKINAENLNTLLYDQLILLIVPKIIFLLSRTDAYR